MSLIESKTKKTRTYIKVPFMAAQEKECALCKEKILVGQNYFRIEPKKMRQASFIACVKCASNVK